MNKNTRRTRCIEALESRLLLSAAARAALPYTGSISGVIYLDLNKDGHRGSDEVGLANLTVYLDSNHNGKLDPGEASTTTAADGTYRFGGLRAGVYHVAELADPDYQQSSPGGSQRVRVAGRGSSITGVDFGDKPISNDYIFPHENKGGGLGATDADAFPLRTLGETPPPIMPTAPVTPLAVTSGMWTAIGPASILDSSNQLNAGRVTGIAASATDPNLIYIAAAGGGVWKTTDAGQSWTPLTDAQTTTVMGSIAIAPSDPNTIYAGTGEDNNSIDSYTGEGILKSTDGGATWTLMGHSTFYRHTLGKIVVSPTDPSTVYAMVAGWGSNGYADSTGIWKSTDGGKTWSNTTKSIDASTMYSDLVMDPANSQTLYCAIGQYWGAGNNGVYKTTDGGTTWNKLGNFPATGTSAGRISLSISAQNSVLYASASNPSNSNMLGVYKSTDGGTTWATISPGSNYMGGQGWYDQTIAVSPANSNLVYVGGSAGSSNAVMMSTDGGTTWTGIAQSASGNVNPHPDHHAAAFDANGNYLDGNDGGIWRLDNNTVGSIQWTDLNANLQITQFVSVAEAATDPTNVFGGAQDNGTSESSAGSLVWNSREGGDGGDVVFSPNNPYRVYRISPIGSFGTTDFFRRSDDGGTGWNSYVNGINANDSTNFYPPFVVDPNSYAGNDRLLLGTDHIYESTNNGVNWNAISAPNTNGWTSKANVDAIGIAASDINTIYASAGGSVFATTNRGASWIQRNISGVSDHIAQIIVDPTNSQIAYAVRDQFDGGKVFRTTNGGVTWTDITGNLQNLPVYSIVLVPNGPGSSDDVLYVGAENGVYTSTNLGTSWTQLGAGLPETGVHTLQLNQNNVLLAGTYGRGTFEIQVGPPVDNVQAAQDGADVRLFWASNPGSATSTGFDIQRSADGGAFTDLGTVAASASTYVDHAVPSGHSYVYRVNLLNGQTPAPGASSKALVMQATGNVNHTGGFANATADLTLNGTSVTNGRLRLTDGINAESRSAFTTLGVGSVANFYTTFDFQFTNPGADGFTFTLQSDAPNTGGKSGGAMGYGGIANSVGVFFNMYSNVSQTGLFTGGSTTATRYPISGNPFHTTNASGQTDVFHVTLSYNSSSNTLSETLVDTTTNATFTHNYSVNLATALNGSSAYAGFTGGTGGLNSTQDVLNWWFSPTGDQQPNVSIAAKAAGDNIVLKLDADHQHIDWTDNGVVQTPANYVNNGNLTITTTGNASVTLDQSAGDFLLGNNVLSESGGTAAVKLLGSPGNDSVTLGDNTIGWSAHSLALGSVSSLAYVDGGGNDIVTANTSTVPVSITTGSGNDAITAAGAANVTLTPGPGPINLQANAGTTTIAANTGTTGIRTINFSNLSIASGATVIAAANGKTNHANRSVLVVASKADNSGAAFTDSGTLDLTDNDMVLKGSTTAAAVANEATVSSLTSAAYDNAKWDKAGLTSSTAGASLAGGIDITALGYGQAKYFPQYSVAGKAFDGIAYSATDVYVKYTYAGDTNLDGKVDGSDYNAIDSNIPVAAPNGTWALGDVNFDRAVSSTDYNIVDSNQGAGAGLFGDIAPQL